MPQSNHHKPTLLIIVSCLASAIPFISLLIKIPNFAVVLSIILIISILLIYYRHWGKRRIIWTSFIAFLSILWLMWAKLCWPYWNSEHLCSVASFPYKYTEDQYKMLCREDALDDLDFARDYIKRCHPVFLDSIPLAFNNAFQNSKKKIDALDSISVSELYSQIQTLSSSLHDGHTFVFSIHKEYHIINYENYGELLAVNGLSIMDFLQTKIKFYSTENIDYALGKIMYDLHIYEHLRQIGLNPDNGIEYTFNTDNHDTITHTFFKDDFYSKTLEASNKDEQSSICYHWTNDSINVGYLNLTTFVCYYPSRKKEFYAELAQFFNNVSQQNIDNVIFDIRENKGGNTKLWYEIMDYVSNKNLDFGTRVVRRGPFMFKHPKTCHVTPKDSSFFTGNIYVLTSDKTFSAAMEFADCLQGNYLAKIVGKSPGNTPNCYTNIVRFCLPHSHLHLQISTEASIVTRPGIVNNRIVPDYECSADHALNKALEIIRQQQ